MHFQYTFVLMCKTNFPFLFFFLRKIFLQQIIIFTQLISILNPFPTCGASYLIDSSIVFLRSFKFR